jgi:hypothetical protein
MRPALKDGKPAEVEVIALDDLLAGSVFGGDGFWEGASERAELGQHLELVEHSCGRFHVHETGDTLGNFIESFDAESQSHAPLAAELVDEDLVAGMALDVFEEQCRAAGF